MAWLAVLACASARAETLSVSGPGATEDTLLRSAAPDTNFDAAFSQVLLSNGASTDKYLARFDLAQLPAGSTVHSATLGVTFNNVWSGGGTVTVRRVTASWSESSATWNRRDGANL